MTLTEDFRKDSSLCLRIISTDFYTLYLEGNVYCDGRWHDGRDNWMRGEFDSKWCYPEEAIAAMMKTLEKDPTLHIEIVSCEPGMQYLEAHIYDSGMWNSF